MVIWGLWTLTLFYTFFVLFRATVEHYKLELLTREHMFKHALSAEGTQVRAQFRAQFDAIL